MTTRPPTIVTRSLTPEMLAEVERADQPHAQARLRAFLQALAEHGPKTRVRFKPPPSRWRRIWDALRQGRA